MSRPEDAVWQVTEKLRVYWTTLEEYKNDFNENKKKIFWNLVKQCVDQLLEKSVEQTYQTNWQKVDVWIKKQLDPGEAEKRIRKEVRGRIQEARQLELGFSWWATQDIGEIGDNVDAWFGEATDPVRVAVPGVPRTQTPQTERVVSVSSPVERALRERVVKLARETGELEHKNEALEEQNKALEAELAELRAAQQLLQKQLDKSQFMVENLRQQIALLEKMTLLPPKAPAPGPAETRMPEPAEGASSRAMRATGMRAKLDALRESAGVEASERREVEAGQSAWEQARE